MWAMSSWSPTARRKPRKDARPQSYLVGQEIDEENIVEVELYKWHSQERIGVALSGKKCWPRVVNLSNNGLACGRIREHDLIISINSTEVFHENAANKLLRETVGRVSIRLYRRSTGFNIRDDLTEAAISECSSCDDDCGGGDDDSCQDPLERLSDEDATRATPVLSTSTEP
uniref:PDZ domain-containing protein n=1 Tax=Prymnesium polylepis TaxID=72548 RepID=A0A7S4HL65_9EUKA|mmetsp:Transcript_19415/g.48225  ORF Transcript_19415/g.48225 Transcript_19415/m.48225 type:complete len:172 (+) Transcript_19415:86-601(+)